MNSFQQQPSTPENSDLQIVMSLNTEQQTKFRCLPKTITKKYMNRHLFQGADNIYNIDENNNIIVTNEIALKLQPVPLHRSKQGVDQLHRLYYEQGVQKTLAELENIISVTLNTANITKIKYLYNSLLKEILSHKIEQHLFQTRQRCAQQQYEKLTLHDMIVGHSLCMILGQSNKTGERN